MMVTTATLPVTEAAMPDVSAFRNAVEISDLELGIQRGRYVGRGQIMYFGVEMNTEWRTASGQVYRAGLNFGVDRHMGRFKPVVTIVHQADVAKAVPPSVPASAPTATISSGGLDTVKGVGQVVQVTGDTNSVRNDISVSLRTTRSETPESPAVLNAGNAGSSSSPGASGAAGQAGTGSSKSLGVTVVVPGQGVASQSISSLGGLRQNVRLTGDMNSVLNQMNLTAEFRALSSPGVRHMRSSFQTMRGLPQVGMF